MMKPMTIESLPPARTTRRVMQVITPSHMSGAEMQLVRLTKQMQARGHEFFDVHAVETSPDHALLAWSSDTDGGERYTVRVRDLATGDERPDELTGTSSWGGLAWSADGRALFYARPDEQMRPHQIWRHDLGTPVDDDVLVLEEPDERFSLYVAATRSERWIVFVAGSKTTSEVHVLPRLAGARITIRPLHTLLAVADGAAEVGATGCDPERIAADAVIVVGERRSRDWRALVGDASGLAIGDALVPRRVAHAIAEGREAARTILTAGSREHVAHRA